MYSDNIHLTIGYRLFVELTSAKPSGIVSEVRVRGGWRDGVLASHNGGICDDHEVPEVLNLVAQAIEPMLIMEIIERL